jgi:hypothetical protein
MTLNTTRLDNSNLLTGLWGDGRLRDASWLLLQLPAFGKHRSQSFFSEPRQREMRIVHLFHDSNTESAAFVNLRAALLI